MKKKWVIAAALVMFTVVAANALTFIYRYEFREWALQFESEKANLSRQEISIAGEQVVYLTTSFDAARPTLLLLHGFSASKENWVRYAAKLSEEFNIIAPDLLGHGETSFNPETDYRTGTQVAMLDALRQKKSIDAWHVVGNSMGGAIALHYATLHPQSILSATLVSPAGIHKEASEMDALLEAEDLNPLLAREPGDMRSVIDFVMSKPPFIPGAIIAVEEERAIEKVSNYDKIFADLRKQMFEGMEAEIAKIKVPTLFIWGEEDRVINVDNLKHFEAILPEAVLAPLEGIGHMAMMEVPSKSAKMTREFIGSL